MTKRPQLRPSDAELEILQILWERGPSTVRDVWEQVKQNRDVGYTTILKQMQVMTEKGFLRADKAERSHVYKPQVSEGRVQNRLLKQLLKRAFRGSAHKLVVKALSRHKASTKELEEIRKLLDTLQERDKKR